MIHEPRWLARLTYFRASGKFYSCGVYISKKEHLFDVWEEVATMQRQGKLPGLRDGATFPIIWVKVPQHPHQHPHLVVAKDGDE